MIFKNADHLFFDKYKKIFLTMNKNIKYIIERFQNFNPAEYQDDDNNIIDPDNIKNIITSIRPANKQELR